MNKHHIFTPSGPLKTPVLLLIFNRPDCTNQVFSAIRKARPKKLYVAADGPRDHFAGEAERCTSAREVATAVDWECEVKTLYRKKNLGCKYAVSEGVRWFFENEEEGIILEDDCLPSPSFFWFCQELLGKYRDDDRVNVIGGRNIFDSEFPEKFSYFFSKYNRIWGWASWSQSWDGYDPDMINWPEIKNSTDYKIKFNCLLEKAYFENVWENCRRGKLDTWDYQWFFHRLMQGGLAAVPMVNLVQNIGLGHLSATHTHIASGDPHKALEMRFPIVHPPTVKVNRKKDYALLAYRMGSLKKRVKLLVQYFALKMRETV